MKKENKFKQLLVNQQMIEWLPKPQKKSKIVKKNNAQTPNNNNNKKRS
jgi:hypothetical protein